MGNRKRIIDLLTDVRYTTNNIEKVADEIYSLFTSNKEHTPKDCLKCGRSGYSLGKPFCLEDFCNRTYLTETHTNEQRLF